MKNLLIYISPNREFDKEHRELTEIQISHSQKMGWKNEDIVVATNFPYEYRGVQAKGMKDYTAFDNNRSTKIQAILQLFDDEITDDLYWFHDHDAFQLTELKKPQLEGAVAGFTDHGWMKTWNAGSFFFTNKARGLFQQIYDSMVERSTNEQDALTYLWQNNLCQDKYRLLNITYNLGIYHLHFNIKRSDKPLQVAHFHPHKPKHLKLFHYLLPESLLQIFKSYGLE